MKRKLLYAGLALAGIAAGTVAWVVRAYSRDNEKETRDWYENEPCTRLARDPSEEEQALMRVIGDAGWSATYQDTKFGTNSITGAYVIVPLAAGNVRFQWSGGDKTTFVLTHIGDTRSGKTFSEPGLTYAQFCELAGTPSPEPPTTE